MAVSSTINNDDEKSYSQQLRETDVKINLVDCMKCFVRISRCQVKLKRQTDEMVHYSIFFLRINLFQIEEQEDCSNTIRQTTLEQQILERREEEEKASEEHHQNQGTSSSGEEEEEKEEEEEEFYGETYFDREDYNPMETYIYLDDFFLINNISTEPEEGSSD